MSVLGVGRPVGRPEALKRARPALALAAREAGQSAASILPSSAPTIRYAGLIARPSRACGTSHGWRVYSASRPVMAGLVVVSGAPGGRSAAAGAHCRSRRCPPSSRGRRGAGRRRARRRGRLASWSARAWVRAPAPSLGDGRRPPAACGESRPCPDAEGDSRCDGRYPVHRTPFVAFQERGRLADRRVDDAGAQTLPTRMLMPARTTAATARTATSRPRRPVIVNTSASRAAIAPTAPDA